ncbi:aminodeoxychorismate synthase component I [Geobacter sp. DSM 9736]|uniref:aminodeoxychorismate synthase component I n=1 Tax=Geobacter sp. DSM 9736 TaxID=1277350 RepID=UPI000B50EB3E|nr:aminodeoxychorismate synthase component I [Geobacter sp. DSM 9736]SNB46770.1 para-aminobenzoate synthetase / 4-amino-4-deoxychorismate lyase [Geobacter sp. DSM 9736]
MIFEPRIALESFSDNRYPKSFGFAGFRDVVAALKPDEVLPALERVEHAVASGLHAVGFLSYEAGAALGQVLTTHEPAGFPLLWFALYERRYATTRTELPDSPADDYRTSAWTPSLTEEEYCRAVETIRRYIAEGDCYQVNFTLRHRFRFEGNPFSLYRDMCRAQRASFCAYIDAGPFQILSASPELFFDLRQGALTACPMKGTAPRGRWHAEDEQIRNDLKNSGKERAENLMIVDLLRNDMGRISTAGSVRVPALFQIETLDTLHQMTSTITSRITPQTGLVQIFRALFPCGSVTGAPKRRVMEIIRELEPDIRGIYTGCIGYLSPNGDALFSVAIRTAVIDATSGTGELGTGSGITWESSAASEYEESILKCRFARAPRPEFQLIETLLYEENAGFFLLERHMARLYRSASYFGFTLRLGNVLDTLNLRARPLRGRNRVRLLLSRNGTFSITIEPLARGEENTLPLIALAAKPVDSHDPFLYHKTTHRPRYTEEMARHSGCTDVVFINERGELTEATSSNVVVKLHGKLVTPPLQAGLLPGTFREELLASQAIREKPVAVEELRAAEDIFLINSVRKWRRVSLSQHGMVE